MLFAQVQLNGSVDLEVSYGGENSSFVKNEIVNEFRNPHLGINQFNLFLFADLGSDFFFNGRLQWDTWGTGKLNPARLSLAFLSWEPLDMPVNISVGRFINPFGLYPRRQLASENAFVNGPLAYNYFINISDTRGFWPAAGQSGAYGSDDVGLTTLYLGGYATGAMADWIVSENNLNVTVGITNAALTSPRNYTNLQNAAVIGRIGFSPFIFWQHGISFSYGSFLQKNAVNASFDRLERFRQMVIGTDWVMAYTYFELSGEFIYAKWDVPGSTASGFKTNFTGELATFSLTNYSYYVDLKYEPPIFTGAYIAARYEAMVFEKYDHPATLSQIPLNPWDNNLMRYSFALGYKISRSVLIKAAVSDQKYEDSIIDNDEITVRSILTFSF
jgi:hypothetical protein